MPRDPILVADAAVAEALRGTFELLRPPARLKLSEWAVEHARLEDGSRFHPFPYQVGILDALNDPGCTQLTVRKSSRIGWSRIVLSLIGFRIVHEPARILVYQPTVDDAEDYGKSDIANLLATPAVESAIGAAAREGTIRRRFFPGGSLRLNGANSPREFRRITADLVLLEEPDGYPPTAGHEGDQVELAFRRAETSDSPLRVAGSTPTVEGHSRIDDLFHQGTQEYRHVQCPHCPRRFPLVFGDGTGPGLRWAPRERPESCWYVCPCDRAARIDEHHKPAMDAGGAWIATRPENAPHRSFHVWAAYSQFPGGSWLEIARAFVRSKDRPHKLSVFVNQVLGEPWRMKGEAPNWRRLYDRREDYEPGRAPMPVRLLTIGVDVQKDRVEAHVWGWDRGRGSWLIERRILPGSPFTAEPWEGLRRMMGQTWEHASGVPLRPVRVMIDAGFATTQVAAFCRLYPKALVYPVTGARTYSAPPLGSPRPVDVVRPGGTKRRGLKVWQVGDHVLKQELYGLLSLDPPTDEEAAAGKPWPDGYVHLSHEADEEFCRQMVAEEWNEQTGAWVKKHANEALDCWKYARAGAIAAGIERMTEADWTALERSLGIDPAPGDESAPPPAAGPRPRMRFSLD